MILEFSTYIIGVCTNMIAQSHLQLEGVFAGIFIRTHALNPCGDDGLLRLLLVIHDEEEQTEFLDLNSPTIGAGWEGQVCDELLICWQMSLKYNVKHV